MPSALLRMVPRLPLTPGVYLFKDADGKVIYVGKANQLRVRVGQYFQKTGLPEKTIRLVEQANDLEFVVTATPKDALILENELIKTYRPKFNIALKDDKSYPYLALSRDTFPRLTLHRGKKSKDVDFFGPFPNGYAAREACILLQKMFRIRHCNNYQFKNRSRPCMQYEIKRCSAPCVGLVDQADYQEQVQHVRAFLSGQSKQLLVDLADKMQVAADELAYERAAMYRDAMSALHTVLTKQTMERQGDYDLWHVDQDAYRWVLQKMVVREGKVRHVEHQAFAQDEMDDQQLSTWVFQHYHQELPAVQVGLFLSETIVMHAVLVDSLLDVFPSHFRCLAVSEKRIIAPWCEMAQRQLQNYLPYLASKQGDDAQSFQGLAALFAQTTLQRMECFDVSHHQGDMTMASCVVMNAAGLQSGAYRLYRLRGVHRGDDYAATEEVLRRRTKSIKDHEQVLWLIDGGLGQIKRAQGVIASTPGVCGLLSIAKGPTRRYRDESYYLWQREMSAPRLVELPEELVFLIQQLRDEAHRFALLAHRRAHRRELLRSRMDDLPGVGPVIKKRLKLAFPSMKDLLAASIEQLSQVPGLGTMSAKRIYNSLHDDLP